MSDKVVVTKSKLTAIANKIRSKLGVVTTYSLDDMPDAIDDIGGGGIPDSELLYDLKVENSTLVESVNGLVPTDSSNINLSNGYIIGTSNSSYLTNKVSFNPCEHYKIELTFDEYNVSDETTLNDLNTLVCFGNNANSHFGLRYSKGDAKWYLSTSSSTSTGNILFVNDNFNYFSGKTLDIYVNCDSSLVKDRGHMTYKCGTDIVKQTTNYYYASNFLQLYYAAYSWRAWRIPVKSIKVYKINNVTDPS